MTPAPRPTRGRCPIAGNHFRAERLEHKARRRTALNATRLQVQEKSKIILALPTDTRNLPTYEHQAHHRPENSRHGHREPNVSIFLEKPVTMQLRGCGLRDSGVSAAGLRTRLDKELGKLDGHTWTTIVGQVCPVTGTPNHDLFKTLYSYGLTALEIKQLEALDNPQVLERIPVEYGPQGFWDLIFRRDPKVVEIERDNPKHLVRYLRAWADLLTEQGADDVVDPRKEPVTA